MCVVVEKRVPGYPGYFARSDGSVRTPSGVCTTGWKGNQQGHRSMYVRGRRYPQFIHRLIAFAFCINPRPDIFKLVDHIDRDPTNNVPTNLRWLNHSLNALNNDKLGCYFCKIKKKFHATINLDNKHRHIGYFATEAEAHNAYVATRDTAFARIYKTLCDETTRTSTDLLREEPRLVPTARRPPLHNSRNRRPGKVWPSYVLLRDLLPTNS